MWRKAIILRSRVTSSRQVHSFARTPRRILTEKQLDDEQGRSRTKAVVYEPSDLVSDQASRAAISSRKKTTRPPGEMTIEQPPFVGEQFEKQKRIKRLDKLNKTTNMNFVQLLANLRTKSYRDKTKQVLLEGRRLIADGLLAGCKLRTLIYTHPKELEHLPLVEGEGERILIDKARMINWSLLDAPPGIMAVVERPDNEYLTVEDVSYGRLPVTVVVDGVRRVDNMGAIIRTLSAAGCERILLTKGTCDPWEEKVLRAGMGAHFRIPIFTNIQWERMINYVPENFRVFLADCNSFEIVKEAASYLRVPELLSSSGQAIDDAEADRFGTGITTNIEEDDPAQTVEVIRHKDGTVLQIEPQFSRNGPAASSGMSPAAPHTLPIFEYHEPSYFGHHEGQKAEGTPSHCLLIVGGETSSLSPAAYQFAHAHSGCKVHISMRNGVNSLNVSTAVGVIAFEVQRQYGFIEAHRKTGKVQGQKHLDDEGHKTTTENTVLVTDGN